MVKARLTSSARHNPGKRALVFALSSLEHDVEQIPREFEYVIHPGKHLFLTYLRGIVYGLGALTAAVIVIPFLMWVVQHLPLAPIAGDFVNAVMQEAR
ncbi:hypothetical protein HYW84_02880 [Candidatus Peregrinibacteria bacterium]|nr:hypothetical protein [Candidatus Peregrinibacteria bacterium]